jgi:hypothetical protein
MTQTAAAEWMPQNAAIWVPALTSLLEQWETYDKLDGYGTDSAKAMARVTMKELLQGNPGPLPAWPRNGSQCWIDWNDAFYTIWNSHLSPADIQTELDNLQAKLLKDIAIKTFLPGLQKGP